MRLILVWMLLGPLLVGAQQPPPPPAPAQDKVKVNYSGLDLEALAQQVEKITKKSFLYQDALLRGKKVTLQSESPLTPDELYRVFQTVCHMHGLVLVPVKGENINLVKIVQTQQAQKEPGLQPILSRGEALPPGDTLVYYLLSPKHIPVPKAMSVLSSAISSSGVLQQVQNSDMILLIDVASAIERAEKLLARVDVPGPPVSTTVLTLQFLSVSQAKGQLEVYLDTWRKAQGGGAEPAGKLLLLADERLNSLDLLGSEEEVKRAEAYLKRIDRDLPPARRTIQYYKLKNVPVADVADSVRQLLGIAIAAREAEEARALKVLGDSLAPTVPPRPAPQPLPGAPVLPGQPTPSPTMPAPTPEAPTARKDTARKGPALPGTAGSPLSEEVEVLPLEGLNTLVVTGNQGVHEEVKKILENVDKRKGQVLIEVAIIQVTGDDSLDFGVEVLSEDLKKNGGLGGGTGFGLGTQSDSNSSGFPDRQTVPNFQGGALRYLNSDISVLIRALATKSSVNILSQPLLLVNDNEDADFTTKVSEPTVAVSQGTVGNVTSFAGFAEAITALRITPQVSPEGYLNLKITQSFEEFTGSSSTSGVPPPKVSNNVTTIITVPDRHTAILGGFTRDATQDSRSGIPILMDIPLLGGLMGRTTTKVTKSRLYLFVRPRILATDGFADLKKTSGEKVADLRKFTRGSKIEPAIDEAFGTQQGPPVKEAPLPFGREERK